MGFANGITPDRTIDGHDRGFTLLELIIVLMLIGLFMVVSIPALRNTLIDDPLKSTGRRLVGYIDGIRELAIREQKGYLIYIDIDGNSLRYLPESEAGKDDIEEPEKNLFSPTGDARLRSVWQKSDGSAGGGVFELWISGQGYLEKTVIHLEDDAGETLSLVVYPFLPGIEIRDGVYEPVQDDQ
ncbi:prepilin-type N-terminal cleavage/methylation domain-containing protein [Desulfopila aestuarii]|uniref:N-terminal methylation motif-containing protein n=1 Tax=Desulfopila aestuarii DSM 18488 TaxID=1121416 RepID=A0A1M7YEF9_9BACT|nr:prepilin-type N-terminal cleavage/methylation domain-containing protein [Desulfopila aestuarii]SHO50888.1 N-terminal methylation motif-containing protein [Desulfopila aestuarii DSM 18488]